MFPNFTSKQDRARKQSQLLFKAERRLAEQATMREAYSNTIFASDAAKALEIAQGIIPQTMGDSNVTMGTAPTYYSESDAVMSFPSTSDSSIQRGDEERRYRGRLDSTISSSSMNSRMSLSDLNATNRLRTTNTNANSNISNMSPAQSSNSSNYASALSSNMRLRGFSDLDIQEELRIMDNNETHARIGVENLYKNNIRLSMKVIHPYNFDMKPMTAIKMVWQSNKLEFANVKSGTIVPINPTNINWELTYDHVIVADTLDNAVSGVSLGDIPSETRRLGMVDSGSSNDSEMKDDIVHSSTTIPDNYWNAEIFEKVKELMIEHSILVYGPPQWNQRRTNYKPEAERTNELRIVDNTVVPFQGKGDTKHKINMSKLEAVPYDWGAALKALEEQYPENTAQAKGKGMPKGKIHLKGRGLKGRGLMGAGTRVLNRPYNLNAIKGTNSASDLKYKQLGSKFLFMPYLEDNRIKITYPNRCPISKLIACSDDMKTLIKDLAYDGVINQELYNSLSISEKSIFHTILSRCHLVHLQKTTLPDPRVVLQFEFDKLRGEIALGNTNPEIIHDLKALSIDMHNQGFLSDDDFRNILMSL